MQLSTLREDILPTAANFTSYTTEEGKWITIKDSGSPVDQTVWTRYVLFLYCLVVMIRTTQNAEYFYSVRSFSNIFWS